MKPNRGRTPGATSRINMPNFAILRTEWTEAFDSPSKAEALAYPDARTACFHARRALELMVHWLYKHDASLRLPYQDNLSALIHEQTFKTATASRRWSWRPARERRLRSSHCATCSCVATGLSGCCSSPTVWRW